MEIKDPIHGAIEVSSSEIDVIDSHAFQRLRAIKQLGFAEFSFPGATHNRYIHSIGVMHLAGLAFDNAFRRFQFSTPQVRARLRQCVRLAALLHDIGHGPLSHTTEEVMPKISELKIQAYSAFKNFDQNQRATHEDYSIKFLLDSGLTQVIKNNFSDVTPLHIACLIDRRIAVPDDFFSDQGLHFRSVLGQIVSSEMDVDRMDYLERDAYFCGTNYGKVELNWLLSNLTCHEVDGEMYLALNRRALYTFDDFLLSRHHMYLMVYFHHKSIIYEEMLARYLTSKDCAYRLPANINEYLRCTDYSLYEHLASVDNIWAKLIANRQPYRMLFEMHAVSEDPRPLKMRKTLEQEGIEVIWASSQARLSKYHALAASEKAPIFVVDQYDLREKPIPIEQCTEIFHKYEETRRIERLYVSGEQYQKARRLLMDRQL